MDADDRDDADLSRLVAGVDPGASDGTDRTVLFRVDRDARGETVVAFDPSPPAWQSDLIDRIRQRMEDEAGRQGVFLLSRGVPPGSPRRRVPPVPSSPDVSVGGIVAMIEELRAKGPIGVRVRMTRSTRRDVVERFRARHDFKTLDTRGPGELWMHGMPIELDGDLDDGVLEVDMSDGTVRREELT